MRLTPRLLWLVLVTSAWPQGVGAGAIPFAPPPQVVDTAFRHDRHTSFACQDCHAMQEGHGALLIEDVADCRSCHHVRQRVDRECAACHRAEELGNVVYPQERVVALSVRDGPEERDLRFSHAPHEGRECVECHVGGPTLTVADLDCQACHEEHHVDTNPGCMSCHRDPPEDAHPLRVHETCTGSGCHTDGPIEVPPRTRVGCLWCHQDRVDHEPQGRCVDCHIVSGQGPSYLWLRPDVR